MKLHVQVDERALDVEVPDATLADAEEFFRKMDRDMDGGWQMSREFVARPDRTQRCQIAADRLLVALSSANETMVMLMAGYILTRLPKVSGVNINTDGEMMETQFQITENDVAPAVPKSFNVPPRPQGQLNKLEALDRAGKEVTSVYRVGRVYRFAVLDPASGQWIESPPLDDEKDAQVRRAQAFKQRFDELVSS